MGGGMGPKPAPEMQKVAPTASQTTPGAGAGDPGKPRRPPWPLGLLADYAPAAGAAAQVAGQNAHAAMAAAQDQRAYAPSVDTTLPGQPPSPLSQKMAELLRDPETTARLMHLLGFR